MLKRIIAVILSMCMMSTVVSAASFSDIAGHWAESEIQYGVDNGMINGYNDGTFKPNNTVSRAEFVKMLTASICKNLNIEISAQEEGEHWVSRYYNFAVENGIVVPQAEFVIDGVGVGVLEGESTDYPIRRWEMAYMLFSALNVLFGFDGEYAVYEDWDETVQTYDEDIATIIGACVHAGLLNGDQNGMINAANNTKRAEAITVVNRLDRIIKEAVARMQEENETDEADEVALDIKTYDVIPEGHPEIEFTMANGDKFTVELYPEYAPQTVANFVALAESGFYDGLTFHRVIKGFVAQGGCPKGDGTGNADGYITGEFAENGFTANTLKHERGTISMARAKNLNSASCQFFICYEEASHLDGSYAAFGKVTEGMEVVDSFLEAGGVELADGEQLVPLEDIVIKEVKRIK